MTATRDSNIGAIVLAAGASKRLGRPKQLVKFEGKTLLRRAAEAVSTSIYDPIIVVLGANIDECRAEIEDLEVRVCINENWRDGMSSSIKAGLKELLEVSPNASGVLITLCDQPFITSEKLDLFAKRFEETGKQIIAAKYDGLAGVPALFSRDLFSDILTIEGDKGARQIIAKYSDSLATINLPEASFDIDTAKDIELLPAN